MIRKAEPRDFDAVKYLNQQIFDFENATCDTHEDTNYPNTEFGLQFYRDICSGENGHSGWVFETEDTIIAYISLREVKETEHRHRKGLKLIQLQTLCVDENHRGQGLGRKLVNHAKETAREMGYSHLKVVALAKNQRARGLYLSCGFEELEVTHEIEL